MTQQFIFVVWPSFVVAGITEGGRHSVRPYGPAVLRRAIEASRTAAYSIGFFVFWLFAVAPSAITCFIQRTSSELNRPVHRPR